MINIGQRVITLRTSKGLTQVQLAQRAGLAQGIIAKLEKATQPNPTINTLVAIASALDVPVTALVQEDAAQPAA